MILYDEFYNSILPGNYALTKSMELTKVTTSGTLWYTKKFLVLYYYIFLSNDIQTREYIQKVILCFDNYIADLDESVRSEAKLFFYPNNDTINFKSENFKVFSDFAGNEQFETQSELIQHFQNAKKYYFSLLMGSGGQRGVKKLFKESVQQNSFVYSEARLNSAVLDASIRVCVEEGNSNHNIIDNSVKYIISASAQDEIIKLSKKIELTYDNVSAIVNRFPHSQPNCNSIKNDLVAFIRNERQILYYYGYFHSKSSGATDFEFSSLTPVGEIGLTANSHEFLCIWEHQKLKMVSQPVIVDIGNIYGLDINPDNFAISYTPYIDILNHLASQNSMTLEEYKCIVSRKKSYFNDNDWNNNIKFLLENLNEISQKIIAYDRKRDIADEDGRKELLKYTLGIRSDMSKDNSTNILGVCRWNNSRLEISDRDKLIKLLDIYTNLCIYKKKKYENLFSECELELKRLYSAEYKGAEKRINSKIKIDWDLYNIRPDKVILFGVMYAMISVGIGNNNFSDIAQYAFENYRSLLRKMGIRTLNAAKKEFRQLDLSLSDCDYSCYLREKIEDRTEVRALYLTQTTEDLMRRIESESDNSSIEFDENRQRNATLVSLMKAYYILRFRENDLLKCECCKDETFITAAGEPYVEFHHFIPFGRGNDGPDHYLNLYALCPNCHRQIHFLSISDKAEKYRNLSDNNYLRLTFVERLRALNEKKLLRSYQLEFLLADNAITQNDYDDVIA